MTPYSDIQERKPYEKASKKSTVRTQKDEPIHEEGCAICEAAPFGASGDHEHTTKDKRGPVETLGGKASTYAEARVRDAQRQITKEAELRDHKDQMESAHREKVSRDAKRKTDIENLLAEIHAMFREHMALQRRKFQLRQKLFAFQFAPETLDEDSPFGLESIAAYRLKLLQEEMRKD